MRERPLRTKQPRKKVEEDVETVRRVASSLPIPEGSPEFKSGFRECAELYAVHRPNTRGVARIMDGHRIILEEACLRAMTRENVARYEGFRACLKELRRVKMIK